MPEVKEEWARSIIGQAIAEIHNIEDIPKVREKVEGTAVGIRPDLMKVFDDLVTLKKPLLKHICSL